MSVFFCLSVRTHISETARANFAQFFVHVARAVAQSSSGGVVTCYVLLVLCG